MKSRSLFRAACRPYADVRKALGWVLLAFVAVADTGWAADTAATLRMLDQRKRQQIVAAQRCQSFYGFHFTDQLPQSGIQFQHQMVEDAGRTYRAAHYDHGNGVVAADVNGDGRIDLFFTTQLGTNQLWLNQGNGRFVDGTARAGVGLVDQIVVSAAFADVDNDGDPDLYVTTVRHGNHLFENLGDGRFREVTHAAGLDYSGHSSGVVFCDFDQDGRLDLLVVNVGKYTSDETGPGGFFRALPDAFQGHLFPGRTEVSRLYRNLGGLRFADVTGQMGLRNSGWNGDATFTDLNHDGFPDLYFTNMQGDDHYFENQQGKGFLDRTAALFPKTPWGAMGVKFFDFNQDGFMDLLVTDMHSDMTQGQTEQALGFRWELEKGKSEAFCSAQWSEAYLQGSSNNIFGNALYQGRADGAYAEVSDAMGVETYWPWGVSVGDLNADGFEDVFVTAGMGYPFRYAVNSLLLNDGGKRFFDMEFVVGVEPRRDRRVEKPWFSLDCSGADRTNSLCAGITGTTNFMGTLSSRSSVILDLDDDGDLDIVTNDFNDAPQILISDLAARPGLHFLKVVLQGTRSNRNGLGATVAVVAGGRRFSRYHDGKSGYLGQSVLPLYFGLGAATQVEQVEVLWPTGERQVVKDGVRLNSTLTVVQGTP